MLTPNQRILIYQQCFTLPLFSVCCVRIVCIESYWSTFFYYFLSAISWIFIVLHLSVLSINFFSSSLNSIQLDFEWFSETSKCKHNRHTSHHHHHHRHHRRRIMQKCFELRIYAILQWITFNDLFVGMLFLRHLSVACFLNFMLYLFSIIPCFFWAERITNSKREELISNKQRNHRFQELLWLDFIAIYCCYH